MNILFVTARLPYPPLKGDQVRGYHHLRLLSVQHKISLLSLVDAPPVAADLEALRPFVTEIVTVPLGRARRIANLARGLVSKLPLQTQMCYTSGMTAAIRQQLGSGNFDLVYVQLARMAPYLEQERSIPRVVDLIDALSLNMRRRFERERGPLRWASYVEWQRMQRYERQICRKFDQVTVNSRLDQATIGKFDNLTFNPNGVDLSHFTFVPPIVRKPSRSIVFSGNMGYFPNVNAVEWFAEQVFPIVLHRIPDARFTIVGASPSERVRKLVVTNTSIEVTGYVADMQTYLAQAALAVVPLQAGSGMQNKVVEAMATGTPLVVTPFALGGLEVKDGEHLLIANDASSFAEKVLQLMHSADERNRLAMASRQLVEDHFSWEKCVDDLNRLFADVVSRKPALKH